MKYPKCDVARWGNADEWDLHDAAQILADIEPPIPGYDRMYPRKAGVIRDQLVESIERAHPYLCYFRIVGDNVYIAPALILGWAQDKGIPIPDGLASVVGKAYMRREQLKDAIELTRQAVRSNPPAGEVPAAPPVASVQAEDRTSDPSPSKRELQIRAIERTVDALRISRMRIPAGAKSRIDVECRRAEPGLFGAGPDPFKKAWQAAVSQGRVRTENHDQYRGN